MNKFALRMIFFFFFAFAGIFCCYSREKLSFSLGLKMNVGEHREEVFTRKRLLSVLHWPVFPSASFSCALDFYAPYFHFANEADLGFPSVAGKMKDEDYTDEKQQRITLFSQHIAELKSHFAIRSSIGIPVQCLSSLVEEEKKLSLILQPGIGVYFSYVKWYANGGYLQYGEKVYPSNSGHVLGEDSHFWKPSWPKIPYKGDGIDYTKKTVFPFVQFDIKLHLKKKWIFGLGVMFSPFVFVYSKDTHFDRKNAYLDNFTPPSYAFETKLDVEWKVVKHCALFASMNYSLHYNKNGETDVYSLIDGKKKATSTRGSAGIVKNAAGFVLGSKFYF